MQPGAAMPWRAGSSVEIKHRHRTSEPQIIPGLFRPGSVVGQLSVGAVMQEALVGKAFSQHPSALPRKVMPIAASVIIID